MRLEHPRYSSATNDLGPKQKNPDLADEHSEDFSDMEALDSSTESKHETLQTGREKEMVEAIFETNKQAAEIEDLRRQTIEDLRRQIQEANVYLEKNSNKNTNKIEDPHSEARGLNGPELAQYIANKFGVKIGSNGDIEGNFLSKNKRLDKALEASDPNYRDLKNWAIQLIKENTPYRPKPKSGIRKFFEKVGFIGAVTGATAGIGGNLENRYYEDSLEKSNASMAKFLPESDSTQNQYSEFASIPESSFDINDPMTIEIIANAPRTGQTVQVDINPVSYAEVLTKDGSTYVLLHSKKSKQSLAGRLIGTKIVPDTLQHVRTIMDINNLNPGKVPTLSQNFIEKSFQINPQNNAPTKEYPPKTSSNSGEFSPLDESDLSPAYGSLAQQALPGETTPAERNRVFNKIKERIGKKAPLSSDKLAKK